MIPFFIHLESLPLPSVRAWCLIYCLWISRIKIISYQLSAIKCWPIYPSHLITSYSAHSTHLLLTLDRKYRTEPAEQLEHSLKLPIYIQMTNPCWTVAPHSIPPPSTQHNIPRRKERAFVTTAKSNSAANGKLLMRTGNVWKCIFLGYTYSAKPLHSVKTMMWSTSITCHWGTTTCRQ